LSTEWYVGSKHCKSKTTCIATKQYFNHIQFSCHDNNSTSEYKHNNYQMTVKLHTCRHLWVHRDTTACCTQSAANARTE